MALTLFAVLTLAVTFVPLWYLIRRATERGTDTFIDLLWRERTLTLALRSLWLSVIVTVLCLVIGIGLAWLVTRTDIPFRRTIQVAAGLPLALPSYVAAFAWIGLWPGLEGRLGSVIVLTTISYPFVYLPVMATLRRCDPALEDAARSLGYGPWVVFGRVTLPQLRLAAVGGALLVGLYVLSDFGAVATMRYEVLTHVIYRSYRASFDRTPAAVYGCLLAAMAFAVVTAEGWTRRRRGTGAKVGSGPVRPQPIVHLGPARCPVLLLPVGLLVVTFAVPAWGMLRWWTRGSSQADWNQFWDALWNTLQVGALGALAVVAVAAPVAFLSVRHTGALSALIERSAYAGHALPGVVVGLSLVFVGVNVVTPMYQRLPLLIVAYLVLFLSLGIAVIQASIAHIPPSLEEVARSLGRTAPGAWRAVTLRLAAPGIGAAAALVFLTIMKELPATIFLRPTGFDTLATRLWSHSSSLAYAAAAPYAVAIVLVAAVPTAVLATRGEHRG